MDSFEKFNECKILDIDTFKSSISGETIYNEDYEYAKTIFQHFDMKTLQDYHKLYLLQDVLLLDDDLTAFREVCIKSYDLYPWHYYTVPGLTWDAGRKYTRVILDVFTEEDKFLFVEAGMRGGISRICRRHDKANHPNFIDIGYYNKEKPIGQLLYLDSNNLHGWAMSQYLPISDFVWLSIKEIEKITMHWIHSIPSDGEHGFIFEVDFANSNDNLSNFSDYPLAPERKSVQECDLSPYQRRLIKEQFRRVNVSPKKTQSDAELEEKVNSTEKLIPDLKLKTKYILHYRTSQLYLQLGLKLTKIHRVLHFRQTAWLKPYIEANTIKQQQAINEFEKNIFMLMKNAFFGKTMENVMQTSSD